MTKSYQTILLKKEGSVLTITLNRPELRNAFNESLITELTQVFEQLHQNKDTRVVILEGAGKAFSAGGDLNWMKASIHYTKDQNREDAMKLSRLLDLMNTLPLPLIGKVHGAALGGGMGLVSVCDVVIATEDTLFGFTEVRLGLIPAVIGPFVMAKIGESRIRALFLTGERFPASKAYAMGLIHQIAANQNELESQCQTMTRSFLENSPQAICVAKQFIQKIKTLSHADQNNLAVDTLAEIRVSPEAQEGIKAFLEKRKPYYSEG